TLLAERARRDGGRVAQVDHALGEVRPVRRRVQANAASAHVARLDAAIAARDADALPPLFADDLEVVHHPTGAEHGREGSLLSFRSLLKARAPRLSHEPLATLGDSLAPYRVS